MELYDEVILDGMRRTADGYLVASAKVARTGIQIYSGREMGRPDMTTVRVYRPQSEVFAKDAMASFAHRPMTLNHPAEMVTAANWRDHAIGQTGDEVARDGEFVRVPMVLMDDGAIRAVESGKNQLSMGYTAVIDWTSGEAPDGQAYDAVQKDLRMNHLAVVAAARGGSELKLGDENGGRTMSDKTRTITVDGIPVEMPDHAAAVVDKALKDAAKAVADAETKVADAAKAIEAKDAEIAKRDAQIDDIKGKVIDGAKLDAAVAARAALVDAARKVVKDFDPSGKSDAQIRHSVVTAKIGDAVKEKSDAYIEARFDALVEGAGNGGGNGPDPVRAAMQTFTGFDDVEKARREADEHLRSAYLGNMNGKGA